MVTDNQLRKAELIREFRTKKIGETYYIREPGKFEGLLLSAVFYYNLAMEGFSDGEIDLSLPAEDGDDEDYTDGPFADYFELDEDDWTLWPELHGDKYIGLYTDDYGFLRVLDSAEVERLLDEDASEGEDN